MKKYLRYAFVALLGVCVSLKSASIVKAGGLVSDEQLFAEFDKKWSENTASALDAFFQRKDILADLFDFQGARIMQMYSLLATQKCKEESQKNSVEVYKLLQESSADSVEKEICNLSGKIKDLEKKSFTAATRKPKDPTKVLRSQFEAEIITFQIGRLKNRHQILKGILPKGYVNLLARFSYENSTYDSTEEYELMNGEKRKLITAWVTDQNFWSQQAKFPIVVEERIKDYCGDDGIEDRWS